MDKFWSGIIERSKKFRDEKSSWLGGLFLKTGVSANIMTGVSLLFGIVSVYYIFENTLMFFVFGLIHYIADGMDGVIARVSKTTVFGKYFDYFSDRTVTLLILLKIGWLFNDYYAYIAAGLFIATQTIYVLSRMKSPILFTRSFLLLFGLLNFPTIAYLTTGVASVYSLARQMQWWTENKKILLSQKKNH